MSAAADTRSKVITRAWSELAAASRPADPVAIAERTGLDVFTVAATVTELVRLGALPPEAAVPT